MLNAFGEKLVLHKDGDKYVGRITGIIYDVQREELAVKIYARKQCQAGEITINLVSNDAVLCDVCRQFKSSTYLQACKEIRNDTL